MASLCFWQTLASILSIYTLPTSSLLSWTSNSISFPTHLSLAASATINEETIYLFGGYLDDTNLPSDKIYKYNINNGFWITLPITIPSSLPIYCYQCTAIINQTLIYIVTQHTNTIYIFDTTNDTFLPSNFISQPLSPINGSYISVTNDSIGEYMYVISYQQSGVHSIPYLQRYNSYTNQWLPSRPFPFPSNGYTSSIHYNHTLFVFAGYTKHCNNNNQCIIDTHNRICGYDIRIHLWTCYKSILNQNKYGAAIIMNHTQNKIYIVAGLNNQNQYSNTIDIFDPNTFICSQIQSLPNIGGLVITSILNNKLIVFGGRNLSSTSVNRVYNSLILQNVSQITATLIPTANPSVNPLETPTFVPSNNPIISPTENPTKLPSKYPTIVPSITPTITPSLFPSNVPTNVPSITPTITPSNTPSKYPSLFPSKYPTNLPSFNPSFQTTLTFHPTNPPKPTYISNTQTTLSVSNITDILNYANMEPTISLSDHYNQLIISAITILILFTFCCIYLCVFTSKRTLEIGQMEWIDFMKYSSNLLKIGMLMEITDIFSDFMYSICLINYNISNVYTLHSIEILAWISFICGIIGSLLFIFELLLARKLYAKIPSLHQQLKQLTQIRTDIALKSTNKIIHQIRIRKVDIDIFAILISCFQDIPQITIIIIATCILSEWTQFSILSLMLSIVSCTLKLLKIMVDFFGCGDDVIEIFGYKDVNNYWNKSIQNSTVSVNITNNNSKQPDATLKNIKFEKIVNALGTDDCEYETDNSNDICMNDDTSSIMSDDSMKANYRMGLMDDSDSDECNDEDNGDIEINVDNEQKQKQKQKKSNNKRPLRISRKCTFKKHKLLMIPEEMNESWSEFDLDIK